MTTQIPILSEAFFHDSFRITRAWLQRVAHMNSCKPPAHPGRLHPFLAQVMAVLRDTDAAPGFYPPKSYCPPPIRFPEHVRFMTAEEVLARWGWEEREARESPEYYGRLVEMLRDMQADEATAELAWERLALHGWASDAYYRFNADDEEGDMIDTPADVDLEDEEGPSVVGLADVDFQDEERDSILGDAADVDSQDEASDGDWEDEVSDDVTMADDADSASPTLPNGITEEDLDGFDPVVRANILRLAAEDAAAAADEDISNIEDIDEVSGWAVPPDSTDEPTEDEIRAWAAAAATAPSEWEHLEEEEGWETDNDEGFETDDDHPDPAAADDDDDDDEIVWPGWAAPGVGFPNPHDHAFPMYLVPHVMHENAWHEAVSTQYVYVRGRLVCCQYSGPRRFESCERRRVGDGGEDMDEGGEEGGEE